MSGSIRTIEMTIKHKRLTGLILLITAVLLGIYGGYLFRATSAPWSWGVFSVMALSILITPGMVIGGLMILMAGMNEHGARKLREVGRHPGIR